MGIVGPGLFLVPILAAAAHIELLEVQRREDLFLLQLNARLNAPVDVVWHILTDYPGLHRLSAAVLESRVLDGGTAAYPLVHTRSHVCVWIFCKDIEHTQRMRRISQDRLEADSVAQSSDFTYGYTRWVLTHDASGTRFELVTELRPAFWVPPLIGPLLVESGLRRTALEALQGLEREALARE